MRPVITYDIQNNLINKPCDGIEIINIDKVLRPAYNDGNY